MLTVDKLLMFLHRENIPEYAYGIYQEKDNAICIDKINDEWLVYYADRGVRNDLGWGKTEAQALNLLKLFLLKEYVWNRKKP
jgi:hypothetical protein